METKKMQDWLNSYSVKMIVVSFLALFLLIPTVWIQEIIKERLKLKNEVEQQMASQWGDSQIVSGPVLNIPFTYWQESANNDQAVEKTAIAHFLPETLNVAAEIVPEIRSRSIYKIPVYKSHLKLSGKFIAPDFDKIDITPNQIKWADAYFTLGISDLRGIKDMPHITINQMECTLEPGVANNDLFESGITVKATDKVTNRNIDFEIDLKLNGSTSLSVEALGKTSAIQMASKWADPSFIGSFLPEKRDVGANGFTAIWTITHLNRNFPQQWANQKHKTHDARLGVQLLMPVDHYQKSTRSVKYAILFIALNFIVFLFIEIRNRKPIHPFQYSLVAFALLLFYTLLTSIGEQIGFNPAFAISAFAITGLISWYSYSLMKSIKPVIWVTLLQLGLYVFLFTILQLQDYALLMGSIGLFIILGLIMKASQQVKWYTDRQD
jgi:inner membrane protein